MTSLKGLTQDKGLLDIDSMFEQMEQMESGRFEQQFEDAMAHMEQAYLNDAHDWCIMFSGGKDSSLILSLTWQMLRRLKPHQRTKTVHVVSADTKVETKQMTDFLKANLENIRRNATGLNVQVHLVQPNIKQSFFYNVIGKGYPFPIPKSPFQWCTSKMKIQPMDTKIKEILEMQEISGLPHNLTMLLGSRVDESSSRATSINKYTDEGDVMGKHKSFDDVRVYYPAKYISTADLWTYLSMDGNLPWGISFDELFAHYSDGKECPMTQDSAETQGPCGATNSRNGCWTCLYAGRNDKMLQTLIDKGEEDAYWLSEWKKYLFDIRNDVRYREPLNRGDIKAALSGAQGNQLNLFDDVDMNSRELSFKYYKRAYNPGKSIYNPGGFTFEIRLKLLQKLFYIQEEIGYDLIDEEELEAVLQVWKDDGFEPDEEELEPVDHVHHGSLILNADGSVNEKETTIKHMAYHIDIKFDMPLDEVLVYLKTRQKLTGKSYFCFLNYADYENLQYVNNVLTFVVSDMFIDTKVEALEALYRYLFPETDEVDVFVEGVKVKNDNIRLDMTEDLMTKYEAEPNSPQFAFLQQWLFQSDVLKDMFSKDLEKLK